MRRINSMLIIPLFTASLCAAQDPGAAPTAADKQWIQSRVDFLGKMFELNPAQSKQLVDTHMSLIPAQQDYLNGPGIKPTLRSLQVGLDQALTTAGEDVRATVLERLNTQLYGIYGKAPMSYANVLSKLEPTLPKEQVDKGYGNMKAHFANQLRSGKVELKRENIDALAGQAVELPSQAVKKLSVNIPPAAPPVNVVPSTPTTPVAAKPQTPTPLPPTPPVAVKPPPPPAPPPREYGPAPAKDTWAAQVDSVSGKYKFRPDQLAQAKKILDQATKLAEGAKDAKPLSEIYGVMNDRVLALASMEQRIAADGEKAVIPPPVTPPQPVTGPIKVVPQPQPTTPTTPGGTAAAKPTDPAAAKPATPTPAAPAPVKPAEPAKP